MFTIVISEKGGAERREAFDKSEINVGRVQGNDLMLPKGNVSKHHARLLFRDGRFIVTDLKSTNGTYVNGRKIAQATIVREGDKIYIGDFVLRLDTGISVSQAAPVPEENIYDDSSGRTPARAPGVPLGNPPGASGGMGSMGAPAIQVTSQGLSPAAAGFAAAGMPAIPAPRGDTPGVAHIPLERDPEESAPGNMGGNVGGNMGTAAMPKVPAPPRVPSVPSQQGGAGNALSEGRVRTQAIATRVGNQAMQPMREPAIAPTAQPVRAPTAIHGRQPPRETQAQSGRRVALMTLADRVAEALDIAQLNASPVVSDQLTQQIERAIREQTKGMRDDGEIPDGVDPDQLARDAVSEFVRLGPVGSLLEEDDVSEIECIRHDCILVTRGGQTVLADPPLSSDEALARLVARLAYQAGKPVAPGETAVERRIAHGAQLVALLPPASTGVFAIRKRKRVEMSIEELVRQGGLSRPMAMFLEHCVAARVNLLVCGGGNDPSAILSALASLSQPAERVVVVQDADEIASHGQVAAISISDDESAGNIVRTAARLRPDRLVVSRLSGQTAPALIEAIAEGASGVVAGASAASLRQAVANLAAQIVLARSGPSAEVARELVLDSFELGIEVVRAADGRLRVSRIAEMAACEPKSAAPRDLFVLSSDAAGDAAFVASGIVPRIASELQARGIRIDPSLFKRSVGR